jgi:outer membrane protein, multidrug efflux system
MNVRYVLAMALAARAAAADELTLESAVRAATTRNERARIAEEARRAAAARIGEARALFLPSLTATATYTRRAFESVRTVGDATVTVQALNALGGNATLGITLFDARSFPLYRQALREDESVRASSANDVRLLGFEAANAYLLALGAEQVVHAAQRRLELAGATLAVARARFAAQIVRANDVTKAELEQATAEQALTQATGDVTAARLQLGFIMGVPADGALAEPQALLDAAAAPAPAADARAAQQRRLDVVADRRHAEALREAALEPLMRYVPTLGLAAQLRATNEAGLSGRTFDWSIAVTATWRIFDGGLGLGERREKSAIAAQAELSTTAQLRQVELGLATAGVALQRGQATITQAAAALTAARKNAEETEQLYRQGLAPALDVATANVDLYAAEVAAIQARYTLAIAFLDLRAAQGLDALGREP